MADNSELMSDQDFGVQSDAEFGVQPEGGKLMSDKDFGVMSDEEFGVKPAPEGFIKSNLRAFAHGILPAAGAIAGGAALGTAIGGPIGTLVGGVLGGVAGGGLASVAQDKGLQATGYDDSPQVEANKEAYPVSNQLSELAPFAGNPGKLAGSALQRIAQGGMLSALDALQQKWQTGKVDPKQVLTSGVFGVAFPRGNRATEALGEAVSKLGPKNIWRRGIKEPTPAAEDPNAPAVDELGDPTTGEELTPDQGPLAVPKGPGTGEDAGTNGSARDLGKDQPTQEGNNGFSTGDVKPDVAAALKETQEPEQAELPLQNPVNREMLQSRQGQGGPTEFPEPDEQLARPRLDPKQLADAAGPAIQADKDLPDEMVGRTPKAAAAIKRSLMSLPQKVAEARKDVNPEPSDAQVAAENYTKGYPGRFAGKEVAIETAKDGIRRNKPGQEPWEVTMPTDYGHLLRTKGADGDPLDIHFGEGDKHFIIDQRDAATGKFDEHKIMSHVKDEADAIDLYNKGFSDNKGPQRLQNITPATEDEINKFANRLSNMPGARKKPYSSEPARELPSDSTSAKPEAAAVREPLTATVTTDVEPHPGGVLPKDRVAVQDMLKDLRAKGDNAKADEIEAMPHGELLKYLADNPLRRRTYGVKTGASAGYPVGDLLNTEGAPITANTPKLAAARGKAIEALRTSFKDNAPIENEAPGATLDRVRKALDQVRTLNDGKEHNADYTHGPRDAHNRAEWTWANEGRKLLKKPTPGNIKNFREIEDKLRDPELALNYLKDRTIEGTIAKTRRSGDEAIGKAEAQRAAEDHADIENKMAEYLDNKRLQADVPHEEAEAMVKPEPVKTAEDLEEPPHRTLDVENPEHRAEMARLLNTDRVPKWKQERDAKAKQTREKVMEQLAARKAAEAKTDEGKTVAVTEADKAKYAKMLDLATSRDAARGKPDVVRGIMDDFKKFVGDTEAAGHPDRAIEDIGRVMSHINKAFTVKWRDPKTWNMLNNLDTPQSQYDQSLSDDLYRTKTQERAQTSANAEWLNAKPKEITPAMLEKFAFARDENDFSKLTPREMELYNDRYALRVPDNDALFELARTFDTNGTMGRKVDNHLYRIVKNGNLDLLDPGQSNDPIEGINNISIRGKGTAQDRTFVALERDSDGKRYVISINKNGFTLWDGYKSYRYKDPAFKFEAGEKYQVAKGDTFTMKDSTMREIEKNALGADRKPMEYYHNMDWSLVAANEQLTKLARNMQFVHDLTETPAWKARATQSPTEAHEKGWELSDLPAFKSSRNTWYVDKDIKAVLDSFANPGFLGNDFSRWRMMGQLLAKSIFWNPVVHGANAGVHYVVGRGWDNLNLKHTAELFGKDLSSVLRQDGLQREILDHGGALMYPGTLMQNSMLALGRLAGQDIKARPSLWDPIAKQFGMGPSDLIKAIYRGSAKSLWAANDMFYTNLYRMHRERGLTIEGAIKATEQDFPNYRIPPKLLGSRALAKGLEEPGLTIFGRYHVGMVNAMAGMIRGMVGKDATPAERFDAVGKLVVLATLGLLVKPYADTLAQKITGNDDASMTPRGALSLPFLIAKAANGDEDISAPLRGVQTFSPMVSGALQLLNNKDFSNKSIFEPGDVHNATHGDLAAAGAVAVQGAEFGLRTVSPFNTAESAYKKGQTVPRSLLDQLLGIHDPGPKGVRYEQKRQNRIQKDANTRQKQGGRGVLEEGYNNMFR